MKGKTSSSKNVRAWDVQPVAVTKLQTVEQDRNGELAHKCIPPAFAENEHRTVQFSRIV